MKKELDALLYERYPLMFAGRSPTSQQTTMARGFTCGDGWFDLIDTLCERLQFWTDHHGAPQIVAEQVKEKFGVLRFHVGSAASPEQRGMIALAEALSARTCDTCGRPGQRMIWGACITRCPDHAPADAVSCEEHEAFRRQLVARRQSERVVSPGAADE